MHIHELEPLLTRIRLPKFALIHGRQTMIKSLFYILILVALVAGITSLIRFILTSPKPSDRGNIQQGSNMQALGTVSQTLTKLDLKGKFMKSENFTLILTLICIISVLKFKVVQSIFKLSAI